jgi:hypothetical protein
MRRRKFAVLGSAAIGTLAVAGALGRAATGQHIAAAPDHWAGRYSLRCDGCEGNVRITPRGRGRYHLAIDIAANGCAGQAQGLGEAAGDRLVFSIPNHDYEGQCRITFRRAGARYRVDADNCQEWHGFACAFEGTARKIR